MSDETLDTKVKLPENVEELSEETYKRCRHFVDHIKEVTGLVFSSQTPEIQELMRGYDGNGELFHVLRGSLFFLLSTLINSNKEINLGLFNEALSAACNEAFTVVEPNGVTH